MKTFPQIQDGSDDHYDPSLRHVHALLLTSGQVYFAVLNAAIDLNLFDIVAKGSHGGAYVSPPEIASQLPIHTNESTPIRLDRMLRFLVSFSLLTCSARTNADGSIERLYGLSPTGKYFVSNQNGSPTWASLFPKLAFHPFMSEIWLNFKNAILEGGIELFMKVHGQTMYQCVEKDLKLKDMFQRTMADISAMHMEKILEVYKGFEGISKLVDVGGSIGQSLETIISMYPSIEGLNFDLPHVVLDAPPYPGIKHVGGDMFERVPEGDAIMIKGITHNWSDEKCLQLFRNCHKALKKGGKVIVIDMIMPEEPEQSNAGKYLSTFDNVMLCQSGGMERTEKEFEILCKRSGFAGFKLVCRALSILGIMEYYN